MAAEDEMVFSLAAEGSSEELGEALQDFPDINKTDTNGMTLESADQLTTSSIPQLDALVRTTRSQSLSIRRIGH